MRFRYLFCCIIIFYVDFSMKPWYGLVSASFNFCKSFINLIKLVSTLTCSSARVRCHITCVTLMCDHCESVIIAKWLTDCVLPFVTVFLLSFTSFANMIFTLFHKYFFCSITFVLQDARCTCFASTTLHLVHFRQDLHSQ